MVRHIVILSQCAQLYDSQPISTFAENMRQNQVILTTVQKLTYLSTMNGEMKIWQKESPQL